MEGYHRSAEVKLSDEVGVKQALAQLGVSYYSLAEWRQKRKAYGDHAFVGSGVRRDALLSETPAFKAYSKAYKKRFAWIKYGKITQEAFYEWSEQAREIREQCANGKISLDEFKEWLDNS
jgi:hypothetical protein